ncbi:MAG: ThuA domain-containing protein [Verrucomicrobiales bacterium]|nr:ThuA domain-containing protein [Verrucomicrobiales bacterium]
MKKLLILLFILVGSHGLAWTAEEPTKVVFLTGDEEYRSEESQPMLARMLERDFGFETVVGFSVDEEGFVDPMEIESLTMTEELVDADLLVLFLRFRRPGREQFQNILDYLASGKPVVAFRTTTHAFRFPHDAGLDGWGYQVDAEKTHSFGGGEKVRELLGQSWITHHGHFDDGEKPLTEVTIREGKASHSILTGVEPFDAYSWLYHVDGGEHTMAGDPDLLLNGRALQSSKIERKQTDQFPLTNPVAWTKMHEGADGAKGRVFMTTLGHPYDFKNPNMRRLAIQGILWALEEEKLIPGGGVNTDTVGAYEPNNSASGDEAFKQKMKPADFTGKE